MSKQEQRNEAELTLYSFFQNIAQCEGEGYYRMIQKAFKKVPKSRLLEILAKAAAAELVDE